MFLDILDGLADGLDLLGLLVGDRDVELLFELHDQFDGVERVGPQVVDEGRLLGDLVLGHAHLLAHDLDDAIFHRHGQTSWYPENGRSRSDRGENGPGAGEAIVGTGPRGPPPPSATGEAPTAYRPHPASK